MNNDHSGVYTYSIGFALKNTKKQQQHR